MAIGRHAPGNQPIDERARERALPRIFLTLYQKDQGFGKVDRLACLGKR